MKFNNRCALITGAAAGIGLATARNLAANGVKLVLTDVNSDGLDKAVAELRESGADAVGFVLDVSSDEDVDRLAAGLE